MDAYLAAFAVIGLGMIAAGFNIAVHDHPLPAPGMTWNRLPIFCWSMIATSALLTLATPVLVMAGLFGLLDRTGRPRSTSMNTVALASCGRTVLVLRPSEVYIMALARVRHRR